MASSNVININNARSTRADRFIGLNQPLSEENQNGHPEFKDFPKFRSRYVKLPDRLKERPANTAHFVALAQTVFDALVKIIAEIEQLKKTVKKM